MHLLYSYDIIFHTMAEKRDLEKQVEQYEAELAEGNPKKKKKSTVKYILNISFVLIVTAVSIVLTLWGNVNNIINNLLKCDWRWLLAIVGVMGLSIMIRSFILFCFARLFTRNYRFHQSIACDQIGQFYNAVTPGASGGQIMQAYTYKKQGVPISSAVSALAMYSIMYQIVLILYNIVAFFFKFDSIMSIDVADITVGGVTLHLPIIVLTIVGFVLNLGVILIVLLMGYWHGFHNFIMGPVIGLLAKIRILKKPDKTRENLRVQVENFKIEFRRLMTNIPFFILIFISFALYITVKFSVPYFCGLALGSEHYEIKYFWDSVFLGNYHQMVTGLIPIPGSAGVSEYFFLTLFYNKAEPASGFFYKFAYDATASECEAMTKAALLIWRSITFIIPIVVAGFTTAFYRASPRKDIAERDDIPDRGTFVSLQAETYVMRKEEVDALVHTTRLSRQAVREKLFKPSSKKKPAKRGSSKAATPGSVSDHEYSNLEIEDDE